MPCDHVTPITSTCVRPHALRRSTAGGEAGGRGGPTELLSPGDYVEVTRGDLKGVAGRIVVINSGGTFTLMPSAECAAQLGFNEKMEIKFEEAVKVRSGSGLVYPYLLELNSASSHHSLLPNFCTQFSAIQDKMSRHAHSPFLSAPSSCRCLRSGST